MPSPRAIPWRTLTLPCAGLLILAPITSSTAAEPAISVASTSLGSWSALGTGVSAPGFQEFLVASILPQDDTVYVGGAFTSASGVPDTTYIAAWADDTWHALGSGAQSSAVFDLASSPDGLFAVGLFSSMSNVADTFRLAQWKDGIWSSIGSVNSSVLAAAATDDTLFIGGYLTEVSGVSVSRIAQYSDDTWSPLGSGMATAPNGLRVMTVSDQTLFVGGSFTDAGGIPEADNIAVWQDNAWSALGVGVSGGSRPTTGIEVIGDTVYAGGQFTSASGVVDTQYFAAWSDDTWNSVPGTLSAGVRAMGSDHEHGLVYVGGDFGSIGSQSVSYIAAWDIGIEEWIPFISASGTGLGSSATAIAAVGAKVYVGGWFTDAGGVAAADRIATWTWAPPSGNNVTSGRIGDQVSITGTGFIGLPTTGSVLLDTVATSYTRDDSTTITFTVPMNAPSGTSVINVTGVGGQGSVGNFTLTADPPPPVPSIPPGKPTNITATAGDGSALATWSPPTTTGSFPISNYQVQSIDGHHTCVTVDTTCDITGLVNGTTYRLKVRALSGAGWGPWSEPSPPVRPVAPPMASIVMTGSRESVRGRPGIQVDGDTTGLDSSTVLRPWSRFPGESSFTEGAARIPLSADGAFTWSRQTGRKITIVISTEDGSVSSQRLVIRP